MDQAKTQFVAQLFEEQAVPLVKYLTARFKNPDEAREVAQEAWLRIFRLEHPEHLEHPVPRRQRQRARQRANAINDTNVETTRTSVT